ncbi:hypothetical protein DFH07DRAFT_178308 [Mycena maculata]|uniref:Transcription factor TFIIIC complex subunit Tfc6 n=1 Tax=Mycena maculata TaxID=230809 RepID=A0AAD7MS48_9AGAR|nr:hypothetical protein DFH07DRAFT_178308 [Mycena maculata]
MSRALRPRKSRPSYTVAFDLGDDEDGQPVAGPSRKARRLVDEDDSESDFAPEKEESIAGGDEDEDEGSPDASVIDDSLDPDDDLAPADDPIIPVSAPKPRAAAKTAAPSRARAKAPAKPKKSTSDVVMPSLGSGAGIARTSKRQIYVLPTPSVHHRHRAVPLHSRIGRVERLAAKPILFGPAVTAPTNNFTHSIAVTSRINRGWGFNVGAGPLWDMVEDRGWYKEALPGDDDVDIEVNRRPVTHHGIRVKSGWELISLEEATPFLPTDSVTTEEGNLRPPPPISCSFGPFDNQRPVEIPMFKSQKNSEFFRESKSHIFNPGAPAWGLDWCPIHTNDREGRSYTQYLAVAPFPTATHSPDVGVKVARPYLACIQIWTLGPTKPGFTNKTDAGVMKCVMVLCIDSGPAHDLKWCPLPSHDSINDQGTRPRKLGLLAGTFEDGSFSIYVVPDPLDVTPADQDPTKPVFVKLPEPLIRIELEETACWSFDWANSELLAIGTSHGTIAVYHLGQALRECCGPNPALPVDILPSHYLTIHQSAIRALAWVRAPPSWPTGAPRTDGDPTVIVSGGYDGLECLTDIREGHGSVMNRTRDVINSMTYSPFGGGPITIDHENIVKVYSVSPSMLGRGHILMEPQGPIWSLHASDYHPQLAVGSADGVCSTTNSLRSTRRGGSVPFFVHKIYQLDYSRKTQEFRMLERFFPLVAQDRPTQAKAIRAEKAKNRDTTYVAPTGTASWPKEIGVQRVVWNCGNGLAASALLASATGSGLCRVDVVWGRWLNDRVPYGSIPLLRMEVEGDEEDAMDVDSDESG